MITNLYTASIYAQSKVDKFLSGKNNFLDLDTTVKSGSGIGESFAPTWDLVMDSKSKKITWDEYRQGYIALLRDNWLDNRDDFMIPFLYDIVVLKCYCPNTSNSSQKCHRYLLIDIFRSISKKYNMPIEYKGEIT